MAELEKQLGEQADKVFIRPNTRQGKRVRRTGFCTRYGHHEFVVMSIGFLNAPVAFIKLMNDVFREPLDKCMIIFIGNIRIYSRSREEHAEHLRIVLGKIGEHQLFSRRCC